MESRKTIMRKKFFVIGLPLPISCILSIYIINSTDIISPYSEIVGATLAAIIYLLLRVINGWLFSLKEVNQKEDTK